MKAKAYRDPMNSRMAVVFFIACLLALFAPVSKAAAAEAVFAGGCFWSVESAFDKLKGVSSAVSGYAGGTVENPTYEQVTQKKTGHLEAVKVTYDPKIISYEDLLQVFWRQIDPTDKDGQFFDRGDNYRTAIFFGNESEKKAAEASREALSKSGRFQKPIVTEIRASAKFYAAEDYHQDYARLSPLRYKAYRIGSGRDSFFEKHWGKDHELPRLLAK